jgi:hypothetical protein
MRRSRMLVAMVLAMLGLMAAGCSQPAKPAGPAMPHALADCLGQPQVRPAEVDVRCADNSLVADHLRWSGWGGSVATAIGTAVINACEFTDCHTGAYQAYRVVLTVSGMVACPKGSHAYASIQYMFVGHFNAWPVSVTDQVIPRPCGSTGPPHRDQQPSVPKSSNA